MHRTFKVTTGQTSEKIGGKVPLGMAILFLQRKRKSSQNQV